MAGSFEVLIAGAGIGGLTTALTLRARGIDSTVIEKAHHLEPLGAGINLLPHAVRELHEIGLGDELSEIAVAPAAIAYYDTRGQLLFREPRGFEGGYGWSQQSVHHGRLQMLLASAVRERLGPHAIHTGAGLTGYSETDHGIQAHTANGDFTAAVLIGADGVRSVVRAQLHRDPLLWSGVRLFRGVAPGQPFLDGRTMAIVKAPDGLQLVVYPIGDGQINWVLMMPESPPGPLPEDVKWNEPSDPSDVLTHLTSWSLGWLDVAELVGRTQPVLEFPMVDRDVLSWWGRGPVTLLGDAAHPMYPVGANGGSQAIVDARVLADELARAGVDGLRRYEDNRRGPTGDVVLANREMHRSKPTPDDLQRATEKYRRDTHADAMVG